MQTHSSFESWRHSRSWTSRTARPTAASATCSGRWAASAWQQECLLHNARLLHNVTCRHAVLSRPRCVPILHTHTHQCCGWHAGPVQGPQRAAGASAVGRPEGVDQAQRAGPQCEFPGRTCAPLASAHGVCFPTVSPLRCSNRILSARVSRAQVVEPAGQEELPCVTRRSRRPRTRCRRLA